MKFTTKTFQFFTYNVHNKLPNDNFIDPLMNFPTDYIFICLQELDKSLQGQNEDSYNIFVQFYDEKLTERNYILCFKQKCAGVGLLVFGKKDNPIIQIQSVQKRFQQTSCQGFISIGFKILATSFIIVGCHLAHGDRLDKRNEQYKLIKELSTFTLQDVLPKEIQYAQTKQKYNMDTADYVIVFGDTNYRINDKQFLGDKQYDDIQDQDQLYLSIENNEAWEGFNEAQIMFQPTYKLLDKNNYDPNRTPSWCDRVIFKSNLDNLIGEQLSIYDQYFKKYIHKNKHRLQHFISLQYGSIDISDGDHRPVQLISCIDIYIIDEVKKEQYLTKIINQMNKELEQLAIQSNFEIDQEKIQFDQCQLDIPYGNKIEILNHEKGELQAIIPKQYDQWLDVEIVNKQILIKLQLDKTFVQKFQLASFLPITIKVEIENTNYNDEKDLQVSNTKNLEVIIQCQMTPIGLNLINLENVYIDKNGDYQLKMDQQQLSIIDDLLMINLQDQNDTEQKINQLYEIFMSMQQPVLNNALQNMSDPELQVIRKILEVYSQTRNEKLIYMLFQSKVDCYQAENCRMIQMCINEFILNISLKISQVFDDYKQLEVIGQGSFGIVYKVQHKITNQIFACKQINYSNLSKKEKQLLVNEVNIMKHLHHPNIIRYIQKYHDKQNQIISIVMEYCPNGDLQSFIKKHKQTRQYLPEIKVLNIFIQILLGLDYCHYPPESVFNNTQESGNSFNDSQPELITKQVIHRDLKPTNIFIKANGDVAIADFGLCRTLEGNEYAQTICGSPLYQPLEILLKRPYTSSVDIYSLGTILFELLTYQPPYVATNIDSLKLKIQSGARIPIPQCYSQDIIKLVNMMLDNDPTKRPTTKQILNYPLIKNIIQESQNNQMQTQQPQNMRMQINYSEDYPEQHINLQQHSQNPYMLSPQQFEQNLLSKEQYLKEKEIKLRQICNQLRIDFDSL